MAFPNRNVALVTVGALTANQRWQCVWPIVGNAALDTALAAGEIVNWAKTQLIPAWRDVLASDSEIIGIQVEAGQASSFVPYRENFVFGTYPGMVAHESVPQQVSMLFIFRSTEQMGTGNRIKSAKSFFGPPPRDNVEGDLITGLAFHGAMGVLGNVMVTPWVGASGVTYYRALQRKDGTGGLHEVYVADLIDVRHTAFTQRRRVAPVM